MSVETGELPETAVDREGIRVLLRHWFPTGEELHEFRGGISTL